jgi:flagellar hook-associated protein 3 FlgL
MTNRSVLNDLQEQISSGKKVSKPSDDASATVDILSSNVSLNKIEMYSGNIATAQSELDVTDGAFSNLTDVIQRAKELALKASNATTGADELNAIDLEIEQIIQNVKDIGNTKFGDKYIFAGLNTSTPPFQVPTDASGNPISDEIRYDGSAYSATGESDRKTEISDGVMVGVNFTGDNVIGYHYTDATGTLQSSGVLGTLIDLSTALKASPPDYANIRLTLDGLDTGLNTVLNSQANVGGIYNRLEMTKNKLDEDKITITKFKSNAEDIDLVQSISDMNFMQTTLEASLKIGARVIQPSLLNYL